MKKIKILIITTDFPNLGRYGGIWRVYKELSDELVKDKNFEVEIIGYSHSPNKNKDISPKEDVKITLDKAKHLCYPNSGG